MRRDRKQAELQMNNSAVNILDKTPDKLAEAHCESAHFDIVCAEKRHAGEISEIERLVFSHAWNEQMIADSIEGAYDKVFVYIQNNRICGYIIYSVVYDSADLLRVAVRPEHRRRGLGLLLMGRMIEDCQALGAIKIFLEVRESNDPARNMYRSLGFKEISRRKKYYSEPDEDGIVMQADL